VDNLVETTREEVRKYAGQGEGIGLKLYPTLDDVRRIYTVIAVHTLPADEHSTGIVVMAQVMDEHVVILADNTDKPLVDALMQKGVPREQIVLAYAGESVPEKTPVSGD
jgi:hypothetical protein